MHLTFHKLYGISNIIVWDKQKNKPQKQKKQKKVSYIGASAEKEDDDSRQTDAFSSAYPQSAFHQECIFVHNHSFRGYAGNMGIVVHPHFPSCGNSSFHPPPPDICMSDGGPIPRGCLRFRSSSLIPEHSLQPFPLVRFFAKAVRRLIHRAP